MLRVARSTAARSRTSPAGCASSSSPRCSWVAPRSRSRAAASRSSVSPACRCSRRASAAAASSGVVLDAERTEDGFAIGGWPDELPTRGTLLMLADPFSFPALDFLAPVQRAGSRPEVIGGMASAAAGPGGNRLVLDDRILTSGAVGVMCSEDVPIRAVVSQGCRPIGMPLTITSAEHNLAHELAGRPAMERLQEIVRAADRRRPQADARGPARRHRRRRAPARLRPRRLPRPQPARRRPVDRFARVQRAGRGRPDGAVPGARRGGRRRRPPLPARRASRARAR